MGSQARPAGVPECLARTWIALMKRLGFARKTAIGVRSSRISWAHKRHPGLLGIHTSVLGAVQPTSTRRPWRARLQESNDENLREHLRHWLVGFDGHVEPGDCADRGNRRSAT